MLSVVRYHSPRLLFNSFRKSSFNERTNWSAGHRYQKRETGEVGQYTRRHQEHTAGEYDQAVDDGVGWKRTLREVLCDRVPSAEPLLSTSHIRASSRVTPERKPATCDW